MTNTYIANNVGAWRFANQKKRKKQQHAKLLGSERGWEMVKINYNCLDARTLCYKMTSARKAATIKCIIWPFSDFKTYNTTFIKEPIKILL